MQYVRFYLLLLLSLPCSSSAPAAPPAARKAAAMPCEIIVGAEQIDVIKTLVKEKRAGLIVNQTSVSNGGMLLPDALLEAGITVKKIFAPEHGFRGTDDAGAAVENCTDALTGIPIVSLYGKNFRPTSAHLADIDVLIFDIQDVGARFYTYISTLHYAMEACAGEGKEFIVLDRPNPNDYVDGPVRRKEFASFVGVDPIPVLHGLTTGELARMINGEGWLSTGRNSCRLTVVPMKGWRHGMACSLPVKPSPNLPNDVAVRLYPSLCFFEGTAISVARGTPFPFQALGAPDRRYGRFSFTPQPVKGMDMNPVHRGKTCCGEDLRGASPEGGLSLSFLIRFFEKSGRNAALFFSRPEWFDLLAGTDQLRQQIIDGLSEEEIRASWQSDLEAYRRLRKKYLLYDDR